MGMERSVIESALKYMHQSYLWVTLSIGKPMRNTIDDGIVSSFLAAASSAYEELEAEAESEEEVTTIWETFKLSVRMRLRKYGNWAVEGNFSVTTLTGDTKAVWVLLPIAFDSMEAALRELGSKDYGVWRVTAHDSGRSFAILRG